MLRRDDVRLLTLLGPPGVGKTRLGLQVAADLSFDFADGVYFVSLSPIRDPGLVVSAIAQSLHATENPGQPLLETLKRLLAEKQTLLFLDNFEQVMGASPIIGELLEACADLKLLITSREVVRLRGEHEFHVPPLGVPVEGGSQDGEVHRSEAVSLFETRARAVKPGFRLTADNTPIVTEICRKLDGLPLAIELAAARINVLTPRAIADRLLHRLQLLTGGPHDLPERQQTLHSAIEWSYDLLPPEEQKLFRHLALFRAGCTLDAAADVVYPSDAPGGPRPDVLDGVSSLVNKSLLRQEEGEDGESRFSMLETIREYGLALLDRAGEGEDARGRHARYYTALAEEAAVEMRGPLQGEWVARLGVEHDNLRAALDWCRTTRGENVETALRLASSLALFWRVRSHLSEGRERMMAALEAAGSLSAEEERKIRALRAGLLGEAGWLAFLQGDFATARRLSGEGLALQRELGDKRGLATALTRLGATDGHLGDHESAHALLAEGLELSRELGDLYGISTSLNILGELARLRGDFAGARPYYEESLRVKREMGGKMGVAVALHNLARVAHHQGSEEEARELFAESLGLFHELGSKLDVAMCMAGLGGVAAAKGKAERAARLLGAAGALLGKVGAIVWLADRADYAQDIELARGLLDEQRFHAAWGTGQTMSDEEAVRYALGGEEEPARDGAAVRVPVSPGGREPGSEEESTPPPLTPRELDVLRLVADGLTNAQVAERLVLSPNTVSIHLYSIYNKLGVKSRTAATRYAMAQGLAT
jgi:predicted ATPase/DNA-binding CsgD family transcriptional regulator